MTAAPVTTHASVPCTFPGRQAIERASDGLALLLGTRLGRSGGAELVFLVGEAESTITSPSRGTGSAVDTLRQMAALLEGLRALGSGHVLDDVLTQINADSRVVRLFDPKLMPTPGQLKSQIDSHLGHGSPASGASDASQALSDALAELRRSLR